MQILMLTLSSPARAINFFVGLSTMLMTLINFVCYFGRVLHPTYLVVKSLIYAIGVGFWTVVMILGFISYWANPDEISGLGPDGLPAKRWCPNLSKVWALTLIVLVVTHLVLVGLGVRGLWVLRRKKAALAKEGADINMSVVHPEK